MILWHIYIYIPRSSRYVKFLPFGWFFGWRGTNLHTWKIQVCFYSHFDLLGSVNVICQLFVPSTTGAHWEPQTRKANQALVSLDKAQGRGTLPPLFPIFSSQQDINLASRMHWLHFHIPFKVGILPRKLTNIPPEIEGWQMMIHFLLNRSIFRGYSPWNWQLAPENRPLEKEIRIQHIWKPIIFRCYVCYVSYVSCRECIRSFAGGGRTAMVLWHIASWHGSLR